MKLRDKKRRDRDIARFVLAKAREKIGGKPKYRYAAILEMAREKFYLTPNTISRIVSNYEGDDADPNQTQLFTENT